jgi:hypothetical protein
MVMALAMFSLFSWGSALPSPSGGSVSKRSTGNRFGAWTEKTPEAIDWDGACCSDLGEWYVWLEDDHVAVGENPPAETSSLPFKIEAAPKQGEMDLAGSRLVLAVDRGYLVGFDAGEFGGGVWSFATDGTRKRKLTLRASDALADYVSENVHAFARLGRDVLVFEGLTHGGSNSGRVVRLRRDSNEEWQPSLFAELSACPHAVVEESRSTWLLATTTGVWRFDAHRREHRVWQPPGGHLYYPNSIVRDRSAVVYMGMRDMVVRLTPAGGSYSVRVLVPPRR